MLHPGATDAAPRLAKSAFQQRSRQLGDHDLHGPHGSVCLELKKKFLVAFLLLVVRPGATSSVLAPSSCLLLVMPFVTSSDALAPSSSLFMFKKIA